MARRIKDQSADHSPRLKEPVSPSVRGTGKQSKREDKTSLHAIGHGDKGNDNPGGHGRGGKASRG
jgi:hypothetical protein